MDQPEVLRLPFGIGRKLLADLHESHQVSPDLPHLPDQRLLRRGAGLPAIGRTAVEGGEGTHDLGAALSNRRGGAHGRGGLVRARLPDGREHLAAGALDARNHLLGAFQRLQHLVHHGAGGGCIGPPVREGIHDRGVVGLRGQLAGEALQTVHGLAHIGCQCGCRLGFEASDGSQDLGVVGLRGQLKRNALQTVQCRGDGHKIRLGCDHGRAHLLHGRQDAAQEHLGGVHLRADLLNVLRTSCAVESRRQLGHRCDQCDLAGDRRLNPGGQ
mmetsp:Transcript_85780/g.276878  ORF Transcript_85780/g.276878 Transcript_85780/m.276878 type:complete len:271 (+) Transcript_85780:175-987(+)